MVAGEISLPTEVLVLGGGPGGYTAAARAVELGKQVVLIEAGELGGTCLNVGCIPSKALITLGHDIHRARRRISDSTGLVGSVDVDLAAAQKWKDGIVERLRGGVGQLLGSVEVVRGFGRFVDVDRIAVECHDHVAHYRFDDAIIATGSRPSVVAELPFDGDRIVDSTGLLALDTVPERLVVVGGGYIGIELGTALAMLGSTVTIVEMTDRLLRGFDTDIVRTVRQRLDELGVSVYTEARVTGDDGTSVRVEHDDDADDLNLPADCVLVAVGRRPNTDDLQLEDAKVRLDDTGRVTVDEQRRTNARHIFAIGDVTTGPALAHKASAEGRVAAEVICGQPAAFDQLVPLVAFCDPELAAVGVGEDEAKEHGLDVVVGRARFAVNGRALTMDEPRGLAKVVVDTASGVVIGVQIAGPAASEMIAEGAVAVESALRAEDVARTVHPHPTLGEALADAASAAWRRLPATQKNEE
ncbi:dihydrolipoyl dehydrogenase [soil metagenome]